MLYLRHRLPNILRAEYGARVRAGQGTPATGLALLDGCDAGAQRRQIEKFREIHAILRQNTAQRRPIQCWRDGWQRGYICGIDEAGRRSVRTCLSRR